MQQKYAYAYNGLFNWFKGIFMVPSSKAQLLSAYSSGQQS
jgi:hypothetical protein